MSLEQAILDRLEKRNGQIAQLQGTVHALERAADSQREHAILERGRLLEENKQLAAQVADRYQIVTDLHDLYNQRISARDDSLTAAERLCKSLNAEITKRDHELRAHEKELAEQREEIRKLMDGHAEDMKAQAEVQSKYESILTKTTDLGSYAMTLGRKEGEPLEMFMERQALRLAALESKAGPSIEALSAELSVRYAEIAELHKWATGLIENPSFAQNVPERTMHYREIVERINSRPQLDLTATLPAIDWQAICTKREDEIARLNAKVGPLEKLYTTIKNHLDHGIFFSSGAGIYDAVAETAKELSQLTA